MSIKIIRPGIFTTVQDAGRTGHRAAGIGPGGAMDFFACAVANILAGNHEKCPVIEMHFPAAEIFFEEEAIISIAGADFGAHLDDQPIVLCRPFPVKKNETLSFKKLVSGARTYLAIHGGFIAGKWLSSFSTHTKVKAGGQHGRPLIKGDVIALQPGTRLKPIENFPDFSALMSAAYAPSKIVRCIPGPEWDLMDEISKAQFNTQSFSVTSRSDRMGYRLQGTNLTLQQPVELISSPVDAGTLQLLPDGQMIALMADHQTTGGYPRVANVIGADLPLLAQLPVNAVLRFGLTDIENAEEALLSLYQILETIKQGFKTCYDANGYQL